MHDLLVVISFAALPALFNTSEAAVTPPHDGHLIKHQTLSMRCENNNTNTAADCACPNGKPCFSSDELSKTGEGEHSPWPNCHPGLFSFSCLDGSEAAKMDLFECPSGENMTCQCRDGGGDCTGLLPSLMAFVIPEETGCGIMDMELGCSGGSKPAMTFRPPFLPIRCDVDKEVLAGCVCRSSGRRGLLQPRATEKTSRNARSASGS